MQITKRGRWIEEKTPLLLLMGLAGLAVAVGIVLLGIPGALLYEMFTWLSRGRSSPVKPDAAWPLALIVTILWPWGVPAAYFGAPQLVRHSSRIARWAFTLLVEALWILSLCYLLSRVASV